MKGEKNKGFTLVEVLVAVAILSIMVAPILSSFVSVARVNSTSRKRQTATVIGESVLESVKAFSLADVAQQCGYPESGFKLIAGDLEKGTSFEGSACQLSKASGTLLEIQDKAQLSSAADGTFTQSSDKNYYFMITDIPMAGGKYDAVVTYTYDTARNDRTFVDAAGNTVSVDNTLQEISLRVLKYYNLTIEVYKSDDSPLVDTRLKAYEGERPLATITGTKADYN